MDLVDNTAIYAPLGMCIKFINLNSSEVYKCTSEGKCYSNYSINVKVSLDENQLKD